MHIPDALRSGLMLCTLCTVITVGCRPETRQAGTLNSTQPSETPRGDPRGDPRDAPRDAASLDAPRPKGRQGESAAPGHGATTGQPAKPEALPSGDSPSEQKGAKQAPVAQPATADPATTWKAACAELKEFNEYRPLFTEPTPLDELLAWVAEGKHIQLFDEKCRPIRVERNEDELTGKIDVKTTVSRGVKRVRWRTAHFAMDVNYTGPNDAEYEKNVQGNWEEVGGGGMGSLETRSGALNRVTKDAAFYGGAMVSLTVECRTYQEISGTCANGDKRTCRTCVSLRVRAHSRSSGIGFGYAGASVAASAGSSGEQKPSADAPLDCSKPCPPDTLSDSMHRLNAFLKGKELVTLSSLVDDMPILFRSRRACQLHRAKRSRGRK